MKKISNEMKEKIKQSNLFENMNIDNITEDDINKLAIEAASELLKSMESSELDSFGNSKFTKEDFKNWEDI